MFISVNAEFVYILPNRHLPVFTNIFLHTSYSFTHKWKLKYTFVVCLNSTLFIHVFFLFTVCITYVYFDVVCVVLLRFLEGYEYFFFKVCVNSILFIHILFTFRVIYVYFYVLACIRGRVLVPLGFSKYMN